MFPIFCKILWRSDPFSVASKKEDPGSLSVPTAKFARTDLCIYGFEKAMAAMGISGNPMKSLRPESIPSTPMKSPHLCRFNPYICPNKHKFYSLVQSTEINLDIKLNPPIIQPSSIILYLQPWWSAFSTDLFQSIPASLRPCVLSSICHR